VKRLDGQPFALLGVNNDTDKAYAKEVMAKEGLHWRSWWDQETCGPIQKTWAVSHWPMVFVLDHHGRIRYKNPSGVFLDQAVDQLLREQQIEWKAEAK
jgi:hypothetical protein